MIEVADNLTGGTVRCEGARVYLPGYEYLEVYATPHLGRNGFVEGEWHITEATSGWKITLQSSASIDEAVSAAVSRLNRLGLTRARMEADIAQAAAQHRLRSVRH